MVDREQEQARLLAESIGPDGRAGRDLAWIVVCCVLIILLAVAFDFIDAFIDAADAISDRDLNGLLALLFVVPVGATVAAVRRYRAAPKMRQTLHRMSFTHRAPGLATTRFLGEGIERMLGEVRRTHGHNAVRFVDLNGFKKVNDTYGQEIGDQLMVA